MNHPNLIQSARMMPGIIGGLMMLVTLSGCGGSSSSSRPTPITPEGITAVVATVSPGYASGEVELIDLDTDQLVASGGYHSTISDISVSSHKDHYYLLERFMADRIGKVDIDNPAVFAWQYSAISASDTASSNPYDLIFVDEHKAYLIRYGANTAWVVDPSATQESDFFIDELDLSDYAIGGGGGAEVARMSAGAVVGNHLYIAMERLDASWQPSQTAYVAVFDVNTDEEIDTGMGEGSLKGIPLIIKNPGSLHYHADLGLLVQGVGSYAGWDHLGGIDTIDVSDYSVTHLLTGDEDTGRISSMAIIDNTTAYFSTYGPPEISRVVRFNPSNGEVQDEIGYLSSKDIRSVTADPLGRLWVADATTASPGIRVIDPADDSEIDFVSTSMLPADITFTIK